MTTSYAIEAVRLEYRGYEIAVNKAPGEASGDPCISWHIIRQSDRYMIRQGFHYSDGKASDYWLYLQTVIDQELSKEFPWMEVRTNG